jgi:hypothetical protein
MGMPVVERLLFAVSGVAIIAGLVASYAYERSLVDRTQVSAAVTMMMAQSPRRTAPETEGCHTLLSASHLMSPVPATMWLGGDPRRCTPNE